MLRAAARAASFASRRAALSSPDTALFADAWAPLAPRIPRRARDAPARRARAFAADASSHPLLSDHPKRLEVASVLHARPWQRIAIPSLVSSVTTTQKYPVLVDGVSCPMAGVGDPATAYDRDYAHLKLLCDHFIVAPPPHGTTFFTTQIGPLSMRWERHTEVCTYTFARALGGDETQILANPFAEAHVATALVPKPWLRSMPGGVVSATHVALVEGDPADGWGDASSAGGDVHKLTSRTSPARSTGGASSAEQETAQALLKKVKPLFNHSEVITGSSLDRGRFRAYSDWRVHADGFARIAIHHRPDDRRAFVSSAAGKATQRVIELDKYRVLALMGLPFAQELSRTVDALNEELMRVMDAIGDAEKPSAESPNPNLRRELLSRLTALASTARLSRADDGAALAAWARDRFARRRLNVLPDARGLAVADPRAVAAALPRTAAWLADAVPAAHALDAAAPPNANARPRRGADPRRDESESVVASGTSAAGGTSPSGDATSGSFPTEMRAGMSSNPNASPRASPRAGWADPPTALDARRDAARNDSAWRGVSSAATPEGTFRVALARLLDAELQAPSSSESDPLAHARLLPETLEFDATRVRDATRAFDRLATLAACLRAAFGTRATRKAHYDAAVPSLAERIRAILKQSQLEEDEEDERRAETEGDRTTFHRAPRDDRRLLASLEAEIAAAARAAASDRSSRIVRLDSDRAALRDALAARLVLGPDARDAAAAAFVASPLLKAGFRGAVGVALARDVAALAREVMRGVGRVTWAVHAPVYERLGEMLLSERDEI